MRKYLQLTALGTFAAATLLAGCTLRFDWTECESNADCDRLESGGVELVCEANVCVEDATAVECTTDDECTDKAPRTACDSSSNTCVEPMDMVDPDMGAPDAGGDDMSATADAGNDAGEADMDLREACAETSECSGDTELCIVGYCVEATSEDCSEPYGDITAPNVVVLGSILPLSPPYDTIGPPLANSIQLAVDDFNRVGGIPNGSIVWVNCDDRGNAETARRAARHLVDELGVRAIIGPNFSTPFITVVRDVAKDADVFAISPTATADAITTLDDDGLAWRTIAPDTLQAAAIAARIRELQAEQNRIVTIFYKNDAYGVGLFNALHPQVQGIVGNQNVSGVLYEDPANFEFDQAQITAELNRAIGSSPASANLLVMLGTTETVALAGSYFTLRQPVPTLFSHGGVTELPRAVTANEALQPILSGVGQNIFHPTNFPVYQARYASVFPGEPLLTISTLTYDATAVTLLGMATVAEGEEITGTKIAAAMPRLTAKESAEVSYESSSFISDALTILGDGNNLDYVGVSGDLDFDLATGDVRSSFIGLTTVKDTSNQWQLAPNRAFVPATPQSGVPEMGIWFDLCGSSAEFQTCEPNQTCTTLEASTEGCLDQCEPDNGAMCEAPTSWPTASNPMTCVALNPSDPAQGGLCVPQL